MNVKKSYVIELKALAQYGLREQVDAHRLTAQATTKLLNAVRSKERGMKRVKERTAKLKGAD